MGGPHAAVAVAVIKRQMKTSAWPKSSNLKVKSPLASVSLTIEEEIVVQFPFVKSDFLNIHYDA